MTGSVADLSAFLEPRSVAIVGASADPKKIGAKPLAFLRKYRFAGEIFPVNPRGGEVDGLTCYPDVASIPTRVDCAILVTTGEHVLPALRQCANKGVRGAVVISAGFGETGAVGRAAEAEMASFAAQGLRVLGPNNQGTVNLLTGTVVGFNPLLDSLDHFRPGAIGLVSQSSGVGFGLLGLGLERGLGFSHLVTTGNEADLSFADCALALLERHEVRVVVGALEGVKDAGALRRLARRSVELDKPVVILKGATSAVGSRAAVSHTGSMTGRGAVFSAFCRQHGLYEATDFDGLLDLAQALSGPKRPRAGRSFAVVTGTGGTAVMMVDALEREGFGLPFPGPETTERLGAVLPPIASLGNPIDMTTANLGNRALFLETAKIVAADPAFDGLVTVVGPSVGPGGVDYARQIISASDAAPNLFVSWTAPNGPGQAMLREAGIPVAPSPQRLARVMAAMSGREARPVEAAPAPEMAGRATRIAAARAIVAAASGPVLAEHASKALCRLWDLPVPRETLARSIDEAIEAAERIGFPVVLKLQSAAIPHKTEIGGVLLGIRDPDGVAAGYARLLEAAQRHAPDAPLDGILIGEMVEGEGEAIVGVVSDASFGAAVMAGPGGILAEIMGDASFRVAPFDRVQADVLIGETRLGRMATGVRGGPAWDRGALADLLSRVSVMADELDGLVEEIDLNPVVVRAGGGGVCILDALVRLAGLAEPLQGLH